MSSPSSRLRIATIVGTRPEIIKLSRIVAELDRHTDHTLIHTGQNSDPRLSQVFFDELQLRAPDLYLDAARETPAQTIAEVIARSDAIFETLRPDALVIYGDTNSGLSVIPAKRRKIPIFHLEAGNRSFDQRVPEEINRKILDHLSDVNLTHTEHARRYLLAEGLPADRIFKIGSPMPEVLAHYRDSIARSDVVTRLGLTPRHFILVSCHREENVDKPEQLDRLIQCLETLAATFELPVIISTHPRTRRRLGDRIDQHPALTFHPPFGLPDYARLQQEAFCVVSDSGSVTEESSILNFPAVMIREAHERPEGMDEAVVLMAGLNPLRVVQAVTIARRHADEHSRVAAPIPDYEAEQVSRKVLRIVVSYVDYINRVVWSAP